MKKYNNSPAVYDISRHITKNARVYKDVDDKLVVSKGLNSLDFLLWYDERLLENNNINFNIPPFKMILNLIDNKEEQFNIKISSGNVKSNYRLACLVYHAFSKCDSDRIKGISEQYILDNPSKFDIKKKEPDILNWTDLTTFDKSTGCKKIFPYFRSQGIKESLIAELITRQLLSFDNKFNNLIFICQSPFDRYGIEKHGITAKHFMRLEGAKFPFCYWYQKEEIKDFNSFDHCIIFPDTIEMLKYISDNDIDENTIYSSLHTKNFHTDCIDNLIKLCPNIDTEYTFNVDEIPSTTDNVRNIKKTIDIIEPVPDDEEKLILEYLQFRYNDKSIKYSSKKDGVSIFYSFDKKKYYTKDGLYDDLPF